MEQDQEQMHVCRLCGKSFLSGRVLGGHMRCHMKQKSTETDPEVCKTKRVVEDGENDGHGLRENPTKSWKVLGNMDDASSGQENQCKVCGRGFESIRALFGHMRHHSKKRKKGICCKECGEKFESLKALTGHVGCHSEVFKVSDEAEASQTQKPTVEKSLSDCKKLGIVRKKRSRRTRYVNGQNSSASSLKESSCVAESRKEIEEAALCLMMLSRGVRDLDGDIAIAESSETDSLTFELKSSGQSILHSEAGNSVCDRTEFMKTRKTGKKLGSAFQDSEIKCAEKKSGESNSVLSLYEFEKEETSHVKKTLKPAVVEKALQQSELKVADSEPVEFRLRKRVKLEACTARSKERSISKMSTTSDSATKLTGWKTEEDCKRNNQTENLMDIEVLSNLEEFDKEHKCAVCAKVFATGQALGGHKRTHSVKNSEITGEEPMLREHDTSETSDDFGFDIPGNLNEVTEGDSGISSWWAGSDQNHELLVV